MYKTGWIQNYGTRNYKKYSGWEVKLHDGHVKPKRTNRITLRSGFECSNSVLWCILQNHRVEHSQVKLDSHSQGITVYSMIGNDQNDVEKIK